MIDLKTLYEQTTMHCELVETQHDENYKIEVFQQFNTPIFVFVYWSKLTHTITSIVYTIRKGDTK